MLNMMLSNCVYIKHRAADLSRHTKKSLQKPMTSQTSCLSAVYSAKRNLCFNLQMVMCLARGLPGREAPISVSTNKRPDETAAVPRTPENILENRYQDCCCLAHLSCRVLWLHCMTASKC